MGVRGFELNGSCGAQMGFPTRPNQSPVQQKEAGLGLAAWQVALLDFAMAVHDVGLNSVSEPQ